MIAGFLALAAALTPLPPDAKLDIPLSATDSHDIRCAWAFQNAAMSLPKNDSMISALMMGQYWYEGRVLGRHDDLGVSSEIIRRQFAQETAPDQGELTACATAMTTYQNNDITGKLATGAP